MRTTGLNVGASRVTTGNHPLYAEAERALAEFFDAPAAVLTSNGYSANQVAAQALAGIPTQVFLDERAHPSLVDAAVLLRCRVTTFRHRDAADLDRKLARTGESCVPLVITDGHFAHDGSVAPLAEYQRLIPGRGLILVDDSHGVAVLGENGRGSVECEGVGRERLVQTASLSKALGAYGGVVLCTEAIASRIVERSRWFSGNTPLPPPFAAAVIASVEVLRKEPERRARLQSNALRAKAILRSTGLSLPATPSSVLALPTADEAMTGQLRRDLLRAGVFPSFISYPGATAVGRFRFVLSSEHSWQEIERLIEVLNRHMSRTFLLNSSDSLLRSVP